MAKTVYQMKDVDSANILVRLVFETVFEWVEKSGVEKQVLKDPPQYW